MEGEKRSGTQTAALIASLSAIAIILFYILSPPLALFAIKSGIISAPSRTVECLTQFYWPLEWAYENIHFVHELYDQYFSLFGLN